jgi:hypothetical protein
MTDEQVPGAYDPASSHVQQEAEEEILDGVPTLLGGVALEGLKNGRRIDLPNGSWVKVDAVAVDESVLVEAFAHIGPMKGGQKRKVALDTLKLRTVADSRDNPTRLVLAFADQEAVDSIRGWLRYAIDAAGVETVVVPISDATREKLIAAQAKATMVNVNPAADEEATL